METLPLNRIADEMKPRRHRGPKAQADSADESRPYELASRLVTLLSRERSHLTGLAMKLVEGLHPCRHSADFSCVRWYGTIYSFTARQAHVVRAFWMAWENGTPAMRVETLMEAAGVSSDEDVKIYDVFKNNPAFGKLIVPGPAKGTYQLAELEGD